MTLGDMLDRIADEMSRSDLDSQTRLCIKSAIAQYQRRRFYFLEDYGTTFNTVASQEYYGASDNAAIPNFSTIDSLVITVSGSSWAIDKQSKDYFDNVSSTTLITGIPSKYLYYGRQIRLYPIPQDVYAIRVSGDPRLDDVSNTASTNVWFSEAEELIRNAAKRRLYMSYLKNKDAADLAAFDEAQAEAAIVAETVKRSSTTITPTQF